jgi:hypothetical protein
VERSRRRHRENPVADAQTGEVLWKYGSGGPVNAAAVVVNGAVHWGSGYPHFGFVGNNTFYVSARSNETPGFDA